MFSHYFWLADDLGPLLYAIPRGGGPQCFGRGDRGFFGGAAGGDFPGARRLGSTDLQLLILALLAERPYHGYELIKTIEERSDGFYSPSPGVIYPALTFFEEIGHAHSAQEGTRKLYHITAAGRSHLATHHTTAEAILDAFSRIGGRGEQSGGAFPGVGGLAG